MPAPLATATYRLQLTPAFGFDAAAELVPTLATLGVSHLYLSPIAEAVPGSTHGYDVVDHSTVRVELGGQDALTRLLDAAAAAGLGVLIDHVPNHVSVAVPHLNAPWWAMLRDGPDSEQARWFDVDWAGADGKVIVPMLGTPPDAAIAAGELRLDELRGDEVGSGRAGEPVLRYFDSRFPVAPGTEHGSVAEVLARQHYRLAWWRDPARNVRRFFTIDDLVAVRVEDPAVAGRVDTLLAHLVEHPAFAGVRIDHVDGLADPAAYLHGVRELIGDRWLLVEKILAPDETLPSTWPVDGTTGYEHLVHAEHALLDPAGEAPVRALWARTGRPGEFHAIEHAARREVLDGGLAPDVDRLVRTVTAAARRAADDAVDPATWRETIAELTLGLDRYRTYLPEDPASEQPLREAADRAAEARPDLAGEHRRAGRPGADRRRRPRALAAAHRTGDGQRGRGPGLLPLHAAGRAVRGRWRTRHLDDRQRRLPPPPAAGPGRMADDADRIDDTRHQAVGCRAGAIDRPRCAGRLVGTRRGRRHSTTSPPTPTSVCSTPQTCSSPSRPWSRPPRSTPTVSVTTWSRRPGKPSCTRRGPIRSADYEDALRAARP